MQAVYQCVNIPWKRRLWGICLTTQCLWVHHLPFGCFVCSGSNWDINSEKLSAVTAAFAALPP